MAIRPCKDCGGPVSNDAKKCPRCGAKNETQLKNILKWVVVILTCFLLYKCISGFAEITKKQASTSVAVDHSATSERSTSKTDETKGNNWKYATSKDEMRNMSSYFATTVSLNKQDFEFPYNGGSELALTLRLKNNSKDIFINVSKGQILCSGIDGCEVSFKFDDKPIQSITMIEPESHDSDMLFVSYNKTVLKLMNDMKHSKKLTIEVPFYREGKRQFNFDISGLDWKD